MRENAVYVLAFEVIGNIQLAWQGRFELNTSCKWVQRSFLGVWYKSKSARSSLCTSRKPYLRRNLRIMRFRLISNPFFKLDASRSEAHPTRKCG